MQDKIEKYILGELTNIEKAEFEKELGTNTELQAQFEIEQMIVKNVQERAIIDEQIKIAKQHKGKVRNMRLLFYPLLIAASLVLFVYITGLWQQPHYNKLYASVYESYENDYLVTDISYYRGYTSIDTMSILAMQAYESHDYLESAKRIDNILELHENPELLFFLAMSYLETNKTGQAITILEQLYLLAPGYRYYEPTRWYLALAHLKLKQKKKTIEYLNELIELDGAYWDKAKDFLEII